MVTNLRTYEGVPIGGSNFEEFLTYIRGFLGANFAFSTRITNNDGGYFKDDTFEYEVFSAVGAGLTTYFFGPTIGDTGNLFGKLGTEFFRFEVPNPSNNLETLHGAHIQVWENLLTDSESNSSILFSNTNAANRTLPYRPLKFLGANTFDYGYQDIRINGIPQTLVPTFIYPASPSSVFSQQSVEFSSINLGAEYASPVTKTSRYDFKLLNAFSASPSTGVTRSVFEAELDSTARFEFTNFSIDYGGHVLLTRTITSGPVYSYLPQDFSSGTSVAPGHYKVLDYSRGIIKLNVSNQVLLPLKVSELEDNEDVNFTVISAEQLLEETVGTTTNYYTRYGAVYDGNAANAKLIEYIFDGTEHVVQKIPTTDYIQTPGSLLLQDTSQQYSDSTILAISYRATPTKTQLTNAQVNRYRPDVIRFYYHPGIITTAVDPVGSNIRAIVEITKNSWYNRDILTAEYFPVNRTETANYSLITEAEGGLFTDFFNPNVPFQIVDSLTISDLGVNTLTDGQTIVYTDIGGENYEFVGYPYKLSGLLDVNVGTPVNNSIVTWETTSSRWRARTIPQALGYTPFNAAGGEIGGTTRVNGSLGFRNTSAAVGSQSWHTGVYFADGSLTFYSNTDDATMSGSGWDNVKFNRGVAGGLSTRPGTNAAPGISFIGNESSGLTIGSNVDPLGAPPLQVSVGGVGRLRVRENPSIPAEVLVGSTWEKVLSGTVSNDDFASGSINGSFVLADTSVTSNKLANNIDASKISVGVLPTSVIGPLALTNDKIAWGLQADKITTGTLPASVIGANTISNEKIGSVDASKMTTGVLALARIPTITGPKLGTTSTERDWVLARIGSVGVGTIGSYAFLRYTGSSVSLPINPGVSVPGSQFRYAASSGVFDATSSIPSGTWRCMGYIESAGQGTLFVKVSNT